MPERRPKCRLWKQALTDPSYDPDDKPDYLRDNLVERQKLWLEQAWTSAFGYIPNAVPCYNEDQGFFLRPCITVNWHHIVPIGESLRLDGLGEAHFNNPHNLVPISASNHVGRGAWEDDFVIHEDTQEALAQYSSFKQGYLREDPYKTMNRDRVHATNAGLIYHNISLDTYFTQLAGEVTGKFYQRGIPWPEVKHRR